MPRRKHYLQTNRSVRRGASPFVGGTPPPPIPWKLETLPPDHHRRFDCAVHLDIKRNNRSRVFVYWRREKKTQMLKRHFAHEDYYLQLVELFHDVTYRTEMGQLLDLTSQPMDAPSDLTRQAAGEGITRGVFIDLTSRCTLHLCCLTPTKSCMMRGIRGQEDESEAMARFRRRLLNFVSRAEGVPLLPRLICCTISSGYSRLRPRGM